MMTKSISILLLSAVLILISCRQSENEIITLTTLPEIIVGEWYLHSFEDSTFFAAPEAQGLQTLEDTTAWVMEFTVDSSSTLKLSDESFPDYTGGYEFVDSVFMYIYYSNPNATFFWEIIEYDQNSFTSVQRSDDDGPEYRYFRRVE